MTIKNDVITKIDVCCDCLWPRVKKMEARNLFKNFQEGYLKATAETMKITPTETLEVGFTQFSALAFGDHQYSKTNSI